MFHRRVPQDRPFLPGCLRSCQLPGEAYTTTTASLKAIH